MSESKRLRRPPEGGYARGDETRRKIIEAAIGLFGQHGFDGASTREIAARAGVNAPALQYYFENKEGLYRACAEWIADESWRAFEPAVLHARKVLAGKGSDAALIDAFLRLQSAVADRTFVKHTEPDARLFFAREQGGGEPEIGSEVLRERVRDPLNNVNQELLERLTGIPADDPRTTVRLLSLYGQFLLFHLARRTTLAKLQWDDIDAEKAEFIKANVREQTLVLLAHWIRERDAARRA
ncbi:CerR family C-terminal domain-containing protein [Paraburkholderia acidipaludis]|uniref:CerR family C-terminal domain-containing protein n=1 Tax=Paraburkholderia acidipaludis TaxID=660537 RepID=UPI0005B7F585|nr:CerR family C-terminal domain-containing protein [Paraburkholderia acidipaludis]